jgi:predicted CxxxxCH...CXXCH cytochrome family protein
MTAGLLLLAGLPFLTGCGSSTPNPKSPLNTTGNVHAADWLPAGHKAAAEQDQSSCTECHGGDLLGGISRVSCTRCHIGGNSSVHPSDWVVGAVQDWSKHPAYVAGSGNSACSNAACHGAELAGVAESGPSCTSCHLGGVASAHPQDWGQLAGTLHPDYVLSNGGGNCANAACHGSVLGGVTYSGPACTNCHATPAHGVLDIYGAGCSSASCHPANGQTSRLFHPWDDPTSLNHGGFLATNANNTTSCAVDACHGTTLVGGSNANCPSCTSCHLGGILSVHPTEWGAAIITEHQTYVAQNTTSGCANAACHGADLTGGTASAPSCTTCHLGGVTTAHPVDFGGTPALNHSAFVAANGNTGCAAAACHGTDLNGGTAGPACSTCHLGTVTVGGDTLKHPDTFGTTTAQLALNHKAYVDANGTTGCAGYCHGSSLEGVTGSGPACTTCHTSGTPTGALSTNCASCHGKPPVGTTAPNREGAHAEHNALTEVANVCETCHTGAGTGTTSHFVNGAVDVQLVATTYNAKSGTAAHTSDSNGGTCSKVSCHGGQTTQSWRIGTIDVNTQCTSCHAFGADEYNSYSSGEHSFHTTQAFGSGFGCTGCHDSTKLVTQGHFTTLGTTTMNGNAAATILDSIGYASGTCATPGCHVSRAW